MIDRERHVDVEKMSPEEVDVLSIQLGQRINAIVEDASKKVNALLNIYGASAKMQFEITELPEALMPGMKPKRKRGRPRKSTNLNQEQTS